jgi:two-component sensor histidine kinase
VGLALCLHELATNAAKYGALSGPHGRVRLAWRVEGANGRRRLALDWRETGGPTPAPGRQGFGTRLLNRALSAQANAQAQLSFPPDGAHWTAAFDL